MAKRVRYDAFISYRHCKPDSEIAEKIQKKLENFRLPRSVAKQVGKKRIRRVFRDESELAVAADLSDEIDRAVRNSRFLIAICSPEYLDSLWCLKEIGTFLQNNDKKHVLLVLANGEPKTAFPGILSYEDIEDIDEDGNITYTRRPREPLAADCRTENTKERNALIDKAAVRLAAAIFGVEYDELQQRQKKERNMRRTRRTLIAFGILFAVIAICVFFLLHISKQNSIIKQRYADSLATTSDTLLKEGKRLDAVYAARLALSENQTDSYSDLATKALVNALGIYRYPDQYSLDSEIKLPCSLSDFVLSPNEKYIAVRGLDYSRYIIDTLTEEVVFDYEEKAFFNVAFDEERGIIFKREHSDISYYDFKTCRETSLRLPDGEVYDAPGDGYIIARDEGLHFFRGTKQIFYKEYLELNPSLSERFDVTIHFAKEREEAFVFLHDYDSMLTTAYCINLEDGSFYHIELAEKDLLFHITTDGDSIVWLEEREVGMFLHIQDVATGNDKAMLLMDSFGGLQILGDDILVYKEQVAYIYDLDLILINEFRTNDYFYQSEVTEEGILLSEYSGGSYLVKEGDYRYYSIPENVSISRELDEWKFTLDAYYVGKIGDNQISIYKCKSSEYLEEFNRDFDSVTYCMDDAYKDRLKTQILSKEKEFGEDLIYDVIPCENADCCLVHLWDGNAYIYDSETGERIASIYTLDGYISFFYYDAKQEYYYIATDNLEVFDKSFKNIFEIKDGNLVGTDPVTGNIVVAHWNGDEEKNYLVKPISYKEMIFVADQMLDGYEPDERVKAKYSLE